MHPTALASRRARFFAAYSNMLWVTLGSVAAILASGSSARVKPPQANDVLDLTAEIPPDEQGYYHGIPGSSGGGSTGGWRSGPSDTAQYRLPLRLEILRATPNKDGNFVVELLLRNAENTSFDLPSSPKLTTVEKPENKSRRVFFIQLQSAAGSEGGIVALGSATTAGSTSVPGSFTRLDAGKSIKILLLASSNLIRRSFNPESQELAVKAVCNEWRLDDNRFFLSGLSDELVSANTIQFSRHNEQIVPSQP